MGMRHDIESSGELVRVMRELYGRVESLEEYTLDVLTEERTALHVEVLTVDGKGPLLADDIYDPFVVSGLVASSATFSVDVSAGEAYNVVRYTQSGTVNLARTDTGSQHTEYVSVTPDGTLVMETSARPADYLPIADVVVEGSGQIGTITDVRDLSLATSRDFATTGTFSVDSISYTDSDAPDAPSAVTATEVRDMVRVMWTNPADADLSHVRIYRSTSNDFATASQVAVTDGDWYDDGPLPYGTTYYYWVTAVDLAGNESDQAPGATSGATTTTRELQTGDIEDGAVETAKIADLAVTTAKLADGAVTTPTIADGAVTAAKIDSITADDVDAGTFSANYTISGEFASSAAQPRVVFDNEGIAGLANSAVQFEIRDTDGKAYAGGGDVILDSGGLTIVGSNELVVQSGAGNARGQIDGNAAAMQITGIQALVLVSGAQSISPDGDEVLLRSPSGEPIILDSGGLLVRPDGTSTDLGNSTDYWNEIHYVTLTAHTPAMPDHLTGADIVRAIRRGADGVLDKENLPADVIVRPSREAAAGTVRSRYARERSARIQEIVEADGGGRGRAAEWRPSPEAKDRIEAIEAEPRPEPTEDEIQAELSRPDAVGIKTDIVLMATAEALRDLIGTVEDLVGRVSALEQRP